MEILFWVLAVIAWTILGLVVGHHVSLCRVLHEYPVVGKILFVMTGPGVWCVYVIGTIINFLFGDSRQREAQKPKYNVYER
jgi:hypothetical protein